MINVVQKTYGLAKLRSDIIPHVDASRFNPDVHYHHHINGKIYETPVLVKNALSKENCEYVCDIIVNELGSETVDLQRKLCFEDGESITDIVKTNLLQAFDMMMASRHEKNYFCFCEGLIESHLESKSNTDLVKVASLLEYTKEHLFDRKFDCNTHQDLFHYFPEHIKPSNCVVIAGEGASSTVSLRGKCVRQ